MRPRPSLSDAFQPAPPPDAAPAPEPEEHAHRAPSRRGRRGITVYVDPAVHQQLRQISLDEGISLEALTREGFNLVFARRGKPQIAS